MDERTDAAPPPAEGVVRLGLLSDTHGWLDPALRAHLAGVERILHAGDVGSPAVLEALGELAPVTAVRGNIDGGALRDLPIEAVVSVAGIRIALLHIAGPKHRPNATARALLERERPDVLVVGHSHIWTVARNGATLWLNPGAAGHEGFHAERTAALLDLSPGAEPRLWRIALGPRGRRER